MGQLISFPNNLVKKEAKKDPQISALLKKMLALHKAGGIECLMVLYKPPEKPFETLLTGEYFSEANPQLDLFHDGIRKLHVSALSLAIKASEARLKSVIGNTIDKSIFGACMLGDYLDLPITMLL